MYANSPRLTFESRILPMRQSMGRSLSAASQLRNAFFEEAEVLKLSPQYCCLSTVFVLNRCGEQGSPISHEGNCCVGSVWSRGALVWDVSR